MLDSPPNVPPALDGLRRTLAAGEWRGDGLWLRVREDRVGCRAGWKLHLAAAPARYGALLDAVLPVLLEWGGAFKAIAALDALEELNDGRYGLTQVGKAITAYAGEEAAAAQLAAQLAGAARGFDDAPEVVGEGRFAPGAPVYFRYGPFDAAFRIDAMGRTRRLVQRPDGSLVIDDTDGGPGAGVMPQLLPQTPPADHLAYLRDAYLVVHLRQLTAKGGLFLAVERASKRPVAIKTARRGTNSDRFGRDAVWAVEREHAALRELAGPGFPEAGELRRDGAATVALVRPWLDGVTLWDRWTASDGATPHARREMAGALRGTLDAVARAHAAGVIVRDLSPANVLLAEGGPVLLDLESSARIGDGAPAYRRGTPGFYDPAVDRFAPAVPEADRYALLALAWMVQRGEHPAWWFEGLEGAQRGLEPGAWSEAFARAWRARGDAAAFAQAYCALLDAPPPARSTAPPAKETLRAAMVEALRRALAAADLDDPAPPAANLYDGLPGVLLAAIRADASAAAEAVREAGAARVVQYLARTASPLQHIPGYYFGAPGNAASLLALAQALGHDRHGWEAQVSAEILLESVSADSAVPDLGQGLAGYVMAGIVLGRDARARGRRAARRLHEMAQADAGGVRWPWPEGDYGSLSGAACYGAVHGAAGIIRALHEARKAWRVPLAPGRMAHALRWLLDGARPVPGVEDAAWWPVDARDDTCWNALCHGTPGIVASLAATPFEKPPRGLDAWIEKGLRGMACANNAGWCLCHGVASRVHAYAAAARALPPAQFAPFRGPALADAALLARLDLDALERAAHQLYPGETAAGLMTGAPGARLAALELLETLDSHDARA